MRVESEWCDSGPAAESATLSVSLSVCPSVCCLFCVVFFYYCLAAIRQVCCLRESVYMSSVSVFLQNQTSNRESQLGAYTRTHILRKDAHAHTQSHTELHLQSYSSLPQGLSVYVCTYKRFHVYWCFLCEITQTHTHTHTLACLSVCGCKKIDLSSVTMGPAGVRGLNGCLSQCNTHARTHTRTGLRPPLPPGLAVRNTDSGSSLDSDQPRSGFRNAIFTGRLNW